MLTFPSVKINLGLYITNRRQDHYHDILSCFFPVPWNDVLEIVPSTQFEFIQTGTTVPGNKEENLCVKAYHLLQSKHSFPPARIHLHKIVPMGAGLGGGSSDASSTLTALNEVFEIGLDSLQLENYAAKLGSDCAFFIRNRPVIASERGNILEDISLDLKGNHLYIVYPPIHISTEEAYAGVNPKPFVQDFKAIMQTTERWKEMLHNQFEDSIFPKYPLLSKIKQDFYEKGAWYASMSGSGSALFGLFENKLQDPDFSFPFFHVPL